ncbi:mandibular organ-inhibiting hormone-like [Tigriopus californicus]|uniref:mandibular organ-inhibiting hormone-like n=1 Tax=Tigriopus californicus TaxID=6832 RepID=UPI0027D9D7D7|nr:mandibular organ-inhibiting hormone-like [Tigriopus californicus]
MEQLERLYHGLPSNRLRFRWHHISPSKLAFLLFQFQIMADLIQAKSTLMTASSPSRFRLDGYGDHGGAQPTMGTFTATLKRDSPSTTEGRADALQLENLRHTLGQPHKRDYEALECRGMYDHGIFTKLNRICDDCYNLYKDVEVHHYCRSDCFSTSTFRQCLQSLLLDQESDVYLELVEIIGKKRKKR